MPQWESLVSISQGGILPFCATAFLCLSLAMPVRANLISSAADKTDQRSSSTVALGRNFVLRGIALAAEKDYEQAVKSFDGALTVDPESLDAVAARGMARLALRQYLEALDDFDRAVAHETNSADLGYLYSARGMCFFRTGKMSEALHDFDLSVKIAPDNATHWYQRALFFLEIEQPQQALANINQAINLQPDDTDFRTVRDCIIRSLLKDQQCDE